MDRQLKKERRLFAGVEALALDVFAGFDVGADAFGESKLAFGVDVD